MARAAVQEASCDRATAYAPACANAVENDDRDIMLSVVSLLAGREVLIYGDSSIDSGDSLMAAKKRKDWQAHVKGLLRAELSRRNLTYALLANKLAEIGVQTERRNISNKIGRGSFSAVFFIQCMEAIGCNTIHLDGDGR